jgi:MFS family permease
MTGVSLLLPITLSTMAIVLLAPILPQLLAEFSAIPGYEFWVPMILTVPALCVALLSPVAGILGDRFGRRRLLLWSFVVYAVVGVLPVFLSSLPGDPCLAHRRRRGRGADHGADHDHDRRLLSRPGAGSLAGRRKPRLPRFRRCCSSTSAANWASSAGARRSGSMVRRW